MNHTVQAYARGLAVPLDDLLESSALLRDDIQRLLDAFADSWDDQTFRRVFVRASWSYIEAVVFGLKQLVLTACTLGSEDLSFKTRGFLSEQRIEVNSRGEAKVLVVHTETMKNIKMTLKLASTQFDVAWRPAFGNGSWDRLRQSLQIRHRLTHPKTATELQVQDEELDLHREAFMWFAQGFNEFLVSTQRRYGA